MKWQTRATIAGAMAATIALGFWFLQPGAPPLAPARVRPDSPAMPSALPPWHDEDPTPVRDDAWLRARLANVDADLLREPERHRVQILVTRVEPSGFGRRVVSSGYRVDAEYFYPASAIKPFVALAAMRALARLRGDSGRSVDLDTPLWLCRLDESECPRGHDASNLAGGTITVGHEIRKMLLVSNNVAFNRLYDFAGHHFMNDTLHGLGFDSLRLRHRIRGGASAGRSTPRCELHPEEGPMLVVPRRTSDFELDPTPVAGTSVGRAHYDDDGQLVARQAEFRFKNYVSLRDLQRLLLSIVDPSLPGATDTGLSTSERRFLFDALEQDPRDSQNPRYQGERYAISHYKPIWRGVSRELRVISKGGRAYGFEVDNAYLAHRQSGRSMFIAIVAYANPNEIVNDDGYAYHLTASLFEAIAGELSRWLTAP